MVLFAAAVLCAIAALAAGNFADLPLSAEQELLLADIKGEAWPEQDFMALPDVETSGDAVADPNKFAVPAIVNITLATPQGQWLARPSNGTRVWRLGVRTTQAGIGSLIFLFARFQIPEDASLFVYSPDTDRALGPYTQADAVDGKLWTTLLYGTSAILHLVLPSSAQSEPIVDLAAVHMGFRSIGLLKGSDETDETASDENDFKCPLGDAWVVQGSSVAAYIVSGTSGSGYCTGTLINNQRQDRMPYFLTAHHCVASDLTTSPGFTFYWNYQVCVCVCVYVCV
jgi:lysyl endopeptidase